MKKKALPPRVKRMKRAGRLQSARSWLPTYNGKNVVAGYRKRFAVDWVCALKELEMLGVKISARYKQQLLTTVAAQTEAKRRRKVRKEQQSRSHEQFDLDQDDRFAYIAGYTEAGFAYGITWEEWDQLSEGESTSWHFSIVEEDYEDDEDLDIPF
jgi:hypothetical protein